MNGFSPRKQGDIDTSFGTAGVFELRVDGYVVEPGASERLRAMAQTASGELMLAMGCRAALRGWRHWLSRFLPRGLIPQAGWQYGLARLTPNGQLDPSFGDQGVAIEPPLPEETLQAAQPLPTTGGATVLVLRSQGSETWMITRRKAAGDLDGSFGINGYVNLNGIRPSIEPGVVKGFVMPAADDGFFFVGTTKSSENEYGGIVFRFDASGQLNRAFAGKGYALVDLSLGGSGRVTDAVLLPGDGSVVLATASVAGNAQIVRVLASGELDPAFGNGGRVVIDGDNASDRTEVEKIAWWSGGLFAAGAYADRSERIGLLVSLDSSGKIPPGFNGGKPVKIRYGANDSDGVGGLAFPMHLEADNDGRVTVVGSADHDRTQIKRVIVGRHLSSGALDHAFGHADAAGTPKGFYTIDFDRKGFNFIFFGIDVSEDHLTFEILGGDGGGGSNPDRVTVERFVAI